MAEDIIYPKGVVPRNDDFRKAQKMRGEIYNFLKETMEKTVEEAFQSMGYSQKASPAGFYGDGRGYGFGVDEGVYNVKVGSKTDSYLEKRIGLGGKRIVCELHMTIYPATQTVEMHYKNTEDAAFRGFKESEGGYMINEKIIMNFSDMSKFKKEMKEKLKEFAEKEVGYITTTKLGNEDRMEKSTASMVESFTLKSLFDEDYDSISSKIMESVHFENNEEEKEDDDLETDNLLLGDTIKEEEEFVAHGYFTTSNFGGYEIQLSDSGDAARIRYHEGPVSDWLEIQYDRKGKAFVTDPDNGDKLKLDNFMRINQEVTTSGAGGSAGAFAYDAPIGAPRKRSLKTSVPFDQTVNESSNKKTLKESLTEKGIEKVKTLLAKHDSRKVAKMLIDFHLGSISSSDLPDTVTFANGLDEIQGFLNDNKINQAFLYAKEVAQEMLEDEGFMFESNETPNTSIFSLMQSYAPMNMTIDNLISRLRDVKDEEIEKMVIYFNDDMGYGKSPEGFKKWTLQDWYDFNNYVDDSQILKKMKKHGDPHDLSEFSIKKNIQESDGFWEVVPQSTLDGYKKNHIMGAPGAEGVEVNSKEEEEYNSGGVQKFPGGKSFKEEADKQYAEKYMQMNESAKKRYKPSRELTEKELSCRWKRMATMKTNETIRLAESVIPDTPAPPKPKKKLTESTEGLQSLSRNNNLNEGDTVEGKVVVEVRKPESITPVFYKVFQEDYENKSKAYIWDFNTGNLVRNPNFKP